MKGTVPSRVGSTPIFSHPPAVADSTEKQPRLATMRSFSAKPSHCLPLFRLCADTIRVVRPNASKLPVLQTTDPPVSIEQFGQR